MINILSRVQLVYVCIGLAACIGLFYYQATFVWPVQTCESRGGWWSDKYRECAIPIPIWRFTGRMPGQPRAPSSGLATSAYIERGAAPVTHPSTPAPAQH